MSVEAAHRALKKLRHQLANLAAHSRGRDDPERQEVLACIVALTEKYGDPDPPPARRKPVSERPSMPPVLEANRATRLAASKHFKEARRILEGVK